MFCSSHNLSLSFAIKILLRNLANQRARNAFFKMCVDSSQVYVNSECLIIMIMSSK